jgi:hypothetical protein
MALPARHRERPHAVGAHVAERHGLMKISDQSDVATERERVAFRRAYHAPVLGPVDEGVSGFGRSCHRIRSASHKCSSACNRAVGSWRGADLNCVLLGVDGQRCSAGRASLIVGRVVETDAIIVRIGRKVFRAGIDREGDGLLSLTLAKNSMG